MSTLAEKIDPLALSAMDAFEEEAKNWFIKPRYDHFVAYRMEMVPSGGPFDDVVQSASTTLFPFKDEKEAKVFLRMECMRAAIAAILAEIDDT